MQCRNCGAEIADKALICYRCGTATTEANTSRRRSDAARSSSTMLRTIVARRGDSRRRPRGLPVVERAIIGRMARLARALWIAWAVVVWNVVFDQVIVVAGRDYIQAATRRGEPSGRSPNMDDWMRPAVTRGVWLATAARRSHSRRPGFPCAPCAASADLRLEPRRSPAPRAGRDARRRDAARRAAVAVGPHARRSTRRSSILHHMDGARHRHRRHRPARRRPEGGARRRAPRARDRRRPAAIRANCAARTMVADIKPIAEIQQRTGVPIECGAFIGSSPDPAVRGRLDARLPAQVHRGGDHLRRQAGPHGDVRHRGHDAGRSRVAAPAVHRPRSAPAPRGCASRTRSGTRRRTARKAVVHVREVADRGARRRTSASTGTATAIAASASRRASPRSKRARRGCTARRSASASAAATRRSICCWSTS